MYKEIPMNDLKIALIGAAGRMGQALTRAVHEAEGAQIAGGTEIPGSSALGKDIGRIAGIEDLGIQITDNTNELLKQVDAIIDFTTPQNSLALSKICANENTIHVIGTTGFTPEQEAELAEAGQKTTIIKAGNMSLGVNLLVSLTKKVAAALDIDFDIEVVEMHHKHKVDAPSGTALMLGEAAAEGRNIQLAESSTRIRDGITGPRETGNIGFATLRGGSVVGEHTVIFAGEKERIELTHKAEDRSIFARGAVKAALWGRGKSPNIYSMIDVLGI